MYSTWAWPAAEAVHFLGLCLSFGVLLAVNLRILGVTRQTPFAEVHRLLPWGMLGFGANLITGMFFFVGQPGQYIASTPFYWKTIFLMIAGANFLYLTVFGKAWRHTEDGDAGFEASLADKAMAVSSIARVARGAVCGSNASVPRKVLLGCRHGRLRCNHGRRRRPGARQRPRISSRSHRLTWAPRDQRASWSPRLAVGEKRSQLAAAAGMPQLPQCLGFNLADALAGDAKLLAHFFQRVLGAVFEAKTHFDHAFFARRQHIAEPARSFP